jgi:hypothetical protein
MPQLGNPANAMRSFGWPALRSSFGAALIAFVLAADGVANDEQAPAQPGGGSVATSPFAPGPVPTEIRETFGLAPFYQKCVVVGGLPIVGSAKVNDAALAECAWLVTKMLDRRPDILKALAAAKVRFAIMAHDEYTTDIPEHAHLEPRVYWDRRARGLGATPRAPAVSGGEENLLGFPGDPYPREIMSLHEFAHAIHEVALREIDRSFDGRLKDAYEKAIAAGLWKNTYAAVNRQEYWAESVQAWFDNNDANNALHNDISTRDKLRTYDRGVAALCEEVFGDIPWRYQKPADRRPEDRAHLAGYDPAKAPRFQWRAEPVPEHPRVALDCAAGTIQLEFSGPRELLTQLLEQVRKGYFSGGHAVFSEEKLQLSPADQTPDGAPVPAEEGRWNIGMKGSGPDGLYAKIVKGDEVRAKLMENDGNNGVRVQRIVRRN